MLCVIFVGILAHLSCTFCYACTQQNASGKLYIGNLMNNQRLLLTYLHNKIPLSAQACNFLHETVTALPPFNIPSDDQKKLMQQALYSITLAIYTYNASFFNHLTLARMELT